MANVQALLQSTSFPHTPEPTVTIADVLQLKQMQRFDLMAIAAKILDERQGGAGMHIVDVRLVDGSEDNNSTTTEYASLPLTVFVQSAWTDAATKHIQPESMFTAGAPYVTTYMAGVTGDICVYLVTNLLQSTSQASATAAAKAAKAAYQLHSGASTRTERPCQVCNERISKRYCDQCGLRTCHQCLDRCCKFGWRICTECHEKHWCEDWKA